MNAIERRAELTLKLAELRRLAAKASVGAR
jgi:hypothetical protein